MTQRADTTTLAALGLSARGGREAAITGLSVDSRKVRPGHLFAALPGSRLHGAEFIQYALRMGAGAILTDPEGARIAHDPIVEHDPALVVTEDPRAALAWAAALFYGRQPEVMVAVTGTNGKTSVASFTRQIWSLLGLPAVNIGTTGVEGAFAAPSAHTTPEPITLHEMLAEMADHGVTHAAMEASSHGLDQRRLDAVRLAAAGFTNFSQDHLDYHDSFDDYFRAKMGLFTRVLPEDGIGVINIDDAKGWSLWRTLEDARQMEIITVGEDDRARLRILGRRYTATGQELRFSWQNAPRQARLNLIGGFQAENVLMAAGLAIAAGSDPDDVFATFADLSTVRGRMQLAATRENGAAVFVDYAHTPDALVTALAALRPHVMGRIVVVFGAGGDRDRSKRAAMGAAAAEHADIAIVTDDNPRSEDPARIRAMVMQGCAEATEIGDRAEAILRGVDMLGAGDALLIAGKGHETGQTIGDRTIPFSDHEAVARALNKVDKVG